MCRAAGRRCQRTPEALELRNAIDRARRTKASADRRGAPTDRHTVHSGFTQDGAGRWHPATDEARALVDAAERSRCTPEPPPAANTPPSAPAPAPEAPTPAVTYTEALRAGGRTNARSGKCRTCKQVVPARKGNLELTAGRWTVRHPDGHCPPPVPRTPRRRQAGPVGNRRQTWCSQCGATVAAGAGVPDGNRARHLPGECTPIPDLQVSGNSFYTDPPEQYLIAGAGYICKDDEWRRVLHSEFRTARDHSSEDSYIAHTVVHRPVTPVEQQTIDQHLERQRARRAAERTLSELGWGVPPVGDAVADGTQWKTLVDAGEYQTRVGVEPVGTPNRRVLHFLSDGDGSRWETREHPWTPELQDAFDTYQE